MKMTARLQFVVFFVWATAWFVSAENGNNLEAIRAAFATKGVINLAVPHLLEYGSDIGVYSGARTCGPCSLEMCAAYLQHRDPSFENVKRFNALLEPERAGDDFFLRHGRDTTYDEIVRIASQLYGFQGLRVVSYSWERVMTELRKEAPVIVCLRYGEIPQRHDKSYTEGHFLVVCGAKDNQVICQDPDHPKDKVCYPLADLNRAAEGWSMITGFEPLKMVSKKRDRDMWEITFNFDLRCVSLVPERQSEIRGRVLRVPVFSEEQRLDIEAESFDNRIWLGEVVLPRCLYEVECQPPLLDLKDRYISGVDAGLPLLGSTLGIEVWVLEQLGNHLLIVQRIYAYEIGLLDEGGIGKKNQWESVSIRDVILGEQDNPRHRGLGFQDGIAVCREVLDDASSLRSVDVEYYLRKNPLYGFVEGKVVFRDSETGVGLRLVRVKEGTTVPPLPEEVAPEDIRRVREQAFGF